MTEGYCEHGVDRRFPCQKCRTKGEFKRLVLLYGVLMALAMLVGYLVAGV